jgi:hypothetical protein
MEPDIGEPIRRIEVVPLQEPVTDPIPVETPAAPVVEPEKLPELVPV